MNRARIRVVCISVQYKKLYTLTFYTSTTMRLDLTLHYLLAANNLISLLKRIVAGYEIVDASYS